MAIRLEDEYGSGLPDLSDIESQDYNRVGSDRSVFTKIINCPRIYNIPALSFVIIGILGTFLIKLTTKYTELYMKNSLITIIVTNLVLYGISETLAQSLLCYNPTEPRLSFKFHRDATGFGDISFNPNNYRVHETPREDSFDDEPVSAENDDEALNRFIDYIQDDDSTYENPSMQPYNPGLVPSPSELIDLTYFQFDRLAGFMCWGFIMAFVQCWWYKFLQIYSKDPKFIEVLRKVLTDQLCFSPVSLFCFFTYGTIVLESGNWNDVKAKLDRIYLKTLLINYSVWFPVQFFNFLLVPRDFQVPFSSSVSVLWNCFLSMRNSSA
mmetsp:Transcript_9027/g.11269  ORF Transcript_9027/g.11269 Transcript_9027/m.11269 type:complete len:324 (+) Transcript_9027:52-1023(+)